MNSTIVTEKMLFATLPALLQQTITCVKAIANTEILPHFLHVVAERKADGSVLTAADLATQRALFDVLPTIVPVPVLGEEMSSAEQHALWKEALNHALWVVDPIDGTTNFVQGIPYFALSVALMWAGRTILAVTYNPVTEECFSAAAGHGAYLNTQRLVLKNHKKSLAHAVAGIEVRWLPGKLPTRLMNVTPIGSQRNFGASTLDWCLVAAGKLDVYLHGGQKLWDYAAGALILQEAGGQFCGIYHADFWAEDVWQRSCLLALDSALFQPWKKWVWDNR